MTRQQKYPDTSTFHYFNANPKNRITGDCVIRGLATATGIDYNTIVMGCAVVQVETGYDNNAQQGTAIMLERLGWEKHRQPRKPNGRKYTGKEFCRVIQKGIPKDGIVIADRVFAKIGGNHVVAIVGGKVWDTWDSTDGCIGNYWTPKEGAEVKPIPEEAYRFSYWL